MPELLRLDSVNQYADASGRSISLAATDVYEATYVFAFPTSNITGWVVNMGLSGSFQGFYIETDAITNTETNRYAGQQI